MKTHKLSRAHTATYMATRRAVLTGALAGIGALVGGCGTEQSLAGSAGDTNTLVIGSQDYYSNEIIAEIYAQGLEKLGYKIDRQMRIGQREIYMPELKAGAIDLLPDYTGNLLQFLKPKTTVTASQAVYNQLREALPDGLRILNQAPASDQDSYVVTAKLAQRYNLKQIGDLRAVPNLVLGGNSELETRPYGPKGLKSIYGVNAKFSPIEDSGGALTIKALRDNSIQLADIYSSDPVLADSDLVVLADPKSLFLASQVVPVISERIDERAGTEINRISAMLTSRALIEMNHQSTKLQRSARDIAKAWLATQSANAS